MTVLMEVLLFPANALKEDGHALQMLTGYALLKLVLKNASAMRILLHAVILGMRQRLLL